MTPLRLPIAVVLVALAAACAPPPAEPRFPEVTFRDQAPFRFDAATVEVVEAFQPPLKVPHVEHEVPVPPAAMLKRWVADRVVAAGAEGRVRATIVDASIVETELATNQTIAAGLTTEQAVRFDARVELELEYLDARGVPKGAVRGEARRSRTVPEDATLRERDEGLFQMTEDLVNDLDRVLSANIPRYLGTHLVQ